MGYPDSRYAHVTDVLRVSVAPLDDLVEGLVDLVKVDVEGGELVVREGMSRTLPAPDVTLVVEWDPLLQQLAGRSAQTLCRAGCWTGAGASIRPRTWRFSRWRPQPCRR